MGRGGSWLRWQDQYRSLLIKHYLLSKRNIGSTLAQLFMGVFVCLLLLGFQYLANNILVSTTPHPTPIPLGLVPQCVLGKQSMRPVLSVGSGSGSGGLYEETKKSSSLSSNNNLNDVERGCTTLMYAPVSPLTTSIMSRIAINNNLVLGQDILPIPGSTTSPWSDPQFDLWVNSTLYQNAITDPLTGDPPVCSAALVGGCGEPEAWLTGQCMPCALAVDNRTIMDFHSAYTNSTQNSIWFFGSYVNDTSYSIYYNITYLEYPWFTDAHTGTVKAALDTAILQLLAEQQQQPSSSSLQPPFAFTSSSSSSATTSTTSSSAPTPTTPTIDFQYNVVMKSYPKPPPRIVGFDVFASYGGQWLFTVPGLSFFFLLTELVNEKEAKLRIGMSQMGLKSSAYWAAWLTYAGILCTSSTLILQASGYAAGFTFFTNSNFFASFLLFLSFSFAMNAMAMFVSTLITSTKTAQTVGYTFLLIGFLFQAIIDAGYGSLLDLLYSTAVAPWVIKIRTLLMAYPPFPFAASFYFIAAKSSAEINLNLQSVQAGPGFEWSDMFNAVTREVFGYTCNLPAPLRMYAVLWFDTIMFLVLALYLDAVLPGPQGTPAHPLFFLGMKYHSKLPEDSFPADDEEENGSSNSDQIRDATTAAAAQPRPPHETDPGVIAETLAASYSTHPHSSTTSSSSVKAVVRVHRLKVVYRSGWGAFFYALAGFEWRPLKWLGIRGITLSFLSRKSNKTNSSGSSSSGKNNHTKAKKPTSSSNKGAGDVIAVDDLSLTVRPNEILAILGHNGAGKSTTISVLTGLIGSSSGIAEILGHNLSEDPASAQSVMGVCPQHDILWGQLTARETLRLFASIKGVGYQQQQQQHVDANSGATVPSARAEREAIIQAEIDRVLRQVSLSSSSVQNRSVGGYSGGMKRRLSVAIAALGKPPCLFLDEPTTGMDPVNKARVWSLIHRLKKQAGVVLTTHSMEEADSLGDRIAIMAGGKLECIGDPLSLKNRYGNGYRLSMVVANSEQTTIDQVSQIVMRKAPGATLSLRDASNVAFTIPFTNAQEHVPGVLEWCEDQTQLQEQPEHSTTATTTALVKEYGLSGPSLESVFIKVSALAHFDLAESAERDSSQKTQNDNDDDDDEGNEGDVITSSDKQLQAPYVSLSANADALPTPVFTSYGYKALVIKNLTLMFRQRGLCLCQILTPILILGLLLTLQEIIRTEVGTLIITPVPSIFVPLNLDQWLPVIEEEALASGEWKKRMLMVAEDEEGSSSNNAFIPSSATMYQKFQQLNKHALEASSSSSSSSRERFAAAGHLLSDPMRKMRRSMAALYATRTALQMTGSGSGSGKRSRKSSTETEHGTTPTTTTVDFASYWADLLKTKPVPTENCLEFFWHAIQPAADSPFTTNASGLAAIIGKYDRVYAPDDQPVDPPDAFGNTKGLLAHVVATWCTLHNQSLVPAPYWDSRIRLPAESSSSSSFYDSVLYDIDAELSQDLTYLVTANYTNLKNDVQPPCWPRNPDGSQGINDAIERTTCPSYILPDAAIIWHDIRAPGRGSSGTPGTEEENNDVSSPPTPYRLSYTLQSNDDINVLYHRPNGLSRLNIPGVAQPLAIDPGKLAIMDIITRAWANWAGLVSSSSKTTTSSASTSSGGGIFTAAATALYYNYTLPTLVAVASMPDLAVNNVCQIVEIIGAALHPITLTLQLPLFMFVIALEKEGRLVELQSAMGLKAAPYAIVTYGLNLALYTLVATLFWIAAAQLNFTFFLQTSTVLLGATLFGWGLCVCSIATLLSSFLWSRQTAVVTGFACGLFIPLLSSAISAGIYGFSLPWSLGTSMPSYLYAVPILGPCLAFVRILYLGTFNCLAKQQCLQDVHAAVASGSEIHDAMIALYLSAFAYQVLGLYLDAVLPRRYGVAKHPLWFCPYWVQEDFTWFFSCGRILHTSSRQINGNTKKISTGSSSSSSSKRGLSSTKSLFAYISRWAAYAGFGEREAAAVYAKGEDDDVYEGRKIVEETSKLLGLDAPPPPSAAAAAATAGKKGKQRNDDNDEGEGSLPSQTPGGVAALAAKYPVFIRHLRKEFPVESAAKLGAIAEKAKGRKEQEEEEEAAVSSSSSSLMQRPLLASDFGSIQGPSSTSLATSASKAKNNVMANVVLVDGNEKDDGDDEDVEKASFSALTSTTTKLHLGGPQEVDSGISYNEPEQSALMSTEGIKVAVSDMSLAIAPGTIYALLGENGCGKSTTINMLMGIYVPTGGDAYISGRHTRLETDEARLSLGVAPQHDTLWLKLTVEEHLRFYARVKGIDPSHLQAHVQTAMSRVGLAHVANRAAGALSGGMRRRLTLAISLVGDSSCVLLDEPTTGLDPASRRRLWRIIEKAKCDGGGRVLLLVSHDMQEVETLASKIAIMTFGRLRAVGTGQHLKGVYGGGYQLVVRHTGPREACEQAVKLAIPGAKIDAKFTGYMTFVLPPAGSTITTTASAISHGGSSSSSAAAAEAAARGGASSGGVGVLRALPMSRIFLEMGRLVNEAKSTTASTSSSPTATPSASSDGLHHHHGITEWGLGQQTLDTVFQRVVRHYRVMGDNLLEDPEIDEQDDEE